MKFKQSTIMSITTKITLLFGISMFIICIGLASFAYLIAKDALKSSIDENLTELAKSDAKFITEKINIQLTALETLAENPLIKGNELTIEDKLNFLQDEVERSGHKSMMIVDTNGIAHHTTGIVNDIHDREYFKKALAGENAVSDPIVSKSDGSVIVVFAVPIKQEDKVTGVLVARRDGNQLSSYTSEMEFNQREVFMVNKEGTIIASSDKNKVLEMYNIFDEYKSNHNLEGMYNIVKKMTEGKQGVGEYKFNGVTKYMGYYPVEGTNWSLAVTTPKSVVMAKVNELAKVMLFISVFFLIFAIGLTVLIARNFFSPFEDTSNY